jgi:hypothetical protein
VPVVRHEDAAAEQKSSTLTDAVEDSGEWREFVFGECRARPQHVAGDEEDFAG